MIKNGIIPLLFLLIGCAKKEGKIQWITLDPGHFHAALVQKTMYPEIDAEVHVYAAESNDLDLHLSRIKGYNQREENPTSWVSVIFNKANFFEEMLKKEKGGVIMLSGNNQKKTEYILESIKNGFHVYADKPMVIDPKEYQSLEKAFQIAEEKKLVLYDIMTERYEITTVLQKELSQMEPVFGTLVQGSIDTPAIVKSSIHHYAKEVSGKPLIRPAWFFDTKQQGEGLVDVSSHLVDLTFWECFPEQAILKDDIKLLKAKRWATPMSKKDFKQVTSLDSYADYLKPSVTNDSLFVYANGAMSYTLKGHHAKVEVMWNFKAPEGTGDTHYSIMRGSKANLEILQTEEENYIPTLYVNPNQGFDPTALQNAVNSLAKNYPGLELIEKENRWEVRIPKKLREGHEAHFAQVTKRFIQFYKNREIPDWEITNMLTKYYLTTSALEIAQNTVN
ncbi:oxidoreductase [Flavobacteriaceae bacterium]|nr:oxidoreductase [Flavobacteriaceae bacterium]